MASFCWGCTIDLMGEQYADRNDMVRPDLTDHEFVSDLCEHCGYGVFDRNGVRVSSPPDDYDPASMNFLWSAETKRWEPVPA